jgi:hypothetical protein
MRDFDPALPPDNPTISDEEVGIGLWLGQLPYCLDNLRAAAQLLGSPRVDAAGFVDSRCSSVANRCCSTWRQWRSASPRHWNLWLTSSATFPLGQCPGARPCRTGAGWSATPG